MRRRRLHWIWRAGIAVFFGAAGAQLLLVPLEATGRLVARWMISIGLIGTGTAFRVEEHVVFFLPGALLSLIVYGTLSVVLGRPVEDETRCRSCRHILRGISEPRCPECGEKI